MNTEERINDLFLSLGRTKKVEFIDRNIDYASDRAIAKYVKSYLFDVLCDIEDDEYIANFLRGRGYKVEKGGEE